MSGLYIENVSSSFEVDRGARLEVLRDIKFDVESNAFVAVIGPSGSGKSTLFNVIAGLIRPDLGRVLIGGCDVTGQTGHVAYMMQKDLMLPWRTVLDNVTIGPELAGTSVEKRRAAARELMRRFGLDGFESFYPAALSGGMRQRAALMRTILLERNVLLLDEPFGAVDALTRAELQEWLLNIWRDFRRTILLITHDPEEAVLMSDRVYVTTSRPMRIKGAFEINLPRPRDANVAASSEFARLKQKVLRLVREGSLLDAGART